MRFVNTTLTCLVCALSGCSLLFESADPAADSDGGIGALDARADAADGQAPRSCADVGEAPVPVRCLTDDFSAPNPTLWEAIRTSDNNGVDVGSGELRLGMSSSGDDRALLVTKNAYSLVESEVVLQVVRVPDPGYVNVWSVMTVFAPSLDAARAVEIGCNNGEIIPSVSRGDGQGWQELSNPNQVCDTEVSPFWKLSHTGNTVSYWNSEDGVAWNLLATTPDTDLMLDNVVVGVLLENFAPFDGFSSVDNHFVVDAINP